MIRRLGSVRPDVVDITPAIEPRFRIAIFLNTAFVAARRKPLGLDGISGGLGRIGILEKSFSEFILRERYRAQQ